MVLDFFGGGGQRTNLGGSCAQAHRFYMPEIYRATAAKLAPVGELMYCYFLSKCMAYSRSIVVTIVK